MVIQNPVPPVEALASRIKTEGRLLPKTEFIMSELINTTVFNNLALEPDMSLDVHLYQGYSWSLFVNTAPKEASRLI